MQKGDTVTVVAPGYYPQAVQGSGFAFSLASFVAGLLQPLPGAPPGADGRRRGALPLLSLGVSATLPALLRLGGGVPQGYARLLVFDADSNLVSSQTRQLSAAANGGYEPLTVQAIVGQDGYVTAYVGNESPADVYFDDVSVTLGQGLQVQENSYDPYGLSLAGLDYASPGIKGLNQYQFNGKERQLDLGLGWSDYGARMYDAQVPHWLTVDPLADNMRRWSPYSFSFDNPIRFQDPDGMAPGPPLLPIVPSVLVKAVVTVMSAIFGFEMPRESPSASKEGGAGSGQQFNSATGRGDEKGRRLVLAPGQKVEPSESINGFISTMSGAGTTAKSGAFSKMIKEIKEVGGAEQLGKMIEFGSQAKELVQTGVETYNTAKEAMPEKAENGKETQDTIVLTQSYRLSEGRSGAYRTTDQKVQVGNKEFERSKTVRTGPPTENYSPR